MDKEVVETYEYIWNNCVLLKFPYFWLAYKREKCDNNIIKKTWKRIILVKWKKAHEKIGKFSQTFIKGTKPFKMLALIFKEDWENNFCLQLNI